MQSTFRTETPSLNEVQSHRPQFKEAKAGNCATWRAQHGNCVSFPMKKLKAHHNPWAHVPFISCTTGNIQIVGKAVQRSAHPPLAQNYARAVATCDTSYNPCNTTQPRRGSPIIPVLARQLLQTTDLGLSQLLVAEPQIAGLNV